MEIKVACVQYGLLSNILQVLKHITKDKCSFLSLDATCQFLYICLSEPVVSSEIRWDTRRQLLLTSTWDKRSSIYEKEKNLFRSFLF